MAYAPDAFQHCTILIQGKCDGGQGEKESEERRVVCGQPFFTLSVSLFRLPGIRRGRIGKTLIIHGFRHFNLDDKKSLINKK